MAKKKVDAVPVEANDAEVFGDLAIDVKPKTELVWVSNLPSLEKMLKQVSAKYKDIKVTEENFDKCSLIKKNCVTTRRMLEASKKNTLDAYVRLPEATIKAQYEELLSLVNTVESGLDKQFDVYAEERIAELTEIFTDYAKKLIEEYSLEEPYKSRIEMKKSFFNKGTKEADVRKDIKGQIESLLEEQKERKQAEELIALECASDKRINVEFFTAQLAYRPASAVLFDIKKEVERLKGLDSSESPNKIVIGEKAESLADIIGTKKKPSKSKKRDETMKEVKGKLVYPAYAAEALSAFFAEHEEVKWFPAK